MLRVLRLQFRLAVDRSGTVNRGSHQCRFTLLQGPENLGTDTVRFGTRPRCGSGVLGDLQGDT